MKPCNRCGLVPLSVTTQLPSFVVWSHVGGEKVGRPTFVHLCPPCVAATVEGGAIVEQDIIGRMSWAMYEEICRRLGSCPPETNYYRTTKKENEK